MSFRIPDLIAKKRDGGEHTSEEICFFVRELLKGSGSGSGPVSGVAPSQLGAWLMAAYLNGLSPEETLQLTLAMKETGEVMTWPEDWRDSLVDKHSCGGVGDKVSLVLTPALMACDLKVPMISGRGLGLTGGTLDKLESIPGYRVALSKEEIVEALGTIGGCIAGQTGKIAPADKVMYACRDVTGTVGNLSLITSSIVSKKAAENVRALVLDVTFGKGCYQPTLEYAEDVARSLVRVARMCGMLTSAVLTSMDDPLGLSVGNALEVEEAVLCLRGGRPHSLGSGSGNAYGDDLLELVATMGGLLLLSVGRVDTREQGEERIRRAIKSGQALDKFSQMLQFQGVSASTAGELCHGDIWRALRPSAGQSELRAAKSGRIGRIDARSLAEASICLGAGREKPGDQLDHSVGVRLRRVVGQSVAKGEAWATVCHGGDELSQELRDKLSGAIEILDEEEGKWEGKSKVVKIVGCNDEI